MDNNKIQNAVSEILEAVGEDSKREGLIDTPKRVAKAYEEILSGYKQDPLEYFKKTFSIDKEDEIIQTNIDFSSLCEHHLLPFYGKVHIAYLPKNKVLGLSKLTRIVEVYAKRLQLQERLTAQIADIIYDNLDCYGVLVSIEAEHMCMSMRGVRNVGSITKTIALRGEYATNKDKQNTTLNIIKS